MGRLESPLVGDGPVVIFAARLRQLRQSSGSRSYRQLAKSANVAASTLARAASGRTLPSWEVTRAYVAACGGDLPQWRRMWADAAGGRLSRAAAGATGSPQALPADLGDFIGRSGEIELIRRCAQAPARAGGAPRLVAISGPGGIGKTALAVHAAHRLAGDFPDGQLFADLRGCDERPVPPARAAAWFLAACGILVPPGGDPVALFRSAAAGRRLLVVLDNAAGEGQVLPLLPGSAGAMVLVTSRQQLTGLPSVRPVRLGVLGRQHAAQLLARAAGPDRAGSAQDRRSLAGQCGYFPLALRIAGARLATGPAGGAGWLASQLRHEDHRLSQLAAGDLDLAAVFDLSYRHLDRIGQRVFRAIGIFPGPDLAAGPLAVLTGLPAAQIERALARLAHGSLIQPVQPGCYRMHDLLRLYAGECAQRETAPADVSAAIGRLTAWYLHGADAADRMILPARHRPPPGPAPTSGLLTLPASQRAADDWFDAEQANLIAVTLAAGRHDHHHLAWRLPVAIRGLLELRGHTEASIALHQAGLRSARSVGDLHAEGWILTGLATGYWHREAYDQAISCYRQALAIRTELADQRGITAILNNLGSVYAACQNYDEAISCLREALAIHDQHGDATFDASYPLNSLGHIQHQLGSYSDAIPLLRKALYIRRQRGNRNGEAATLHCLGDTLTGLGRHQQACTYLTAALDIFRQIGNQYGQAAALHSLGTASHALDQSGHARRYLRQAVKLYRHLGRHAEESTATAQLAAVSRG